MWMTILAFGIDDSPKDAGGKELFHRVQVIMENGSLKHRVDEPFVLLTAFQQSLGICDVTAEGRNCSGNVFPMLQAEDCVFGVGRRVGTQ